MLSEQKLKERMNYIGASEAASAMGLNPWRSPYSLWCEKTGKLPHKEIDGYHTRLGDALEDFVARAFCEEAEKRAEVKNETIYHPDYPFMAANLDRIVIGEKCPLECKTAGEFMAKEWRQENAPIQYTIQLQYQIGILNEITKRLKSPYEVENGYLAVLIGNSDFKWIKMRRDDELIEEIFSRVKSFWENCVVRDLPPEVDHTDGDALSERYKEAVDGIVVLDHNDNDLIKKLLIVKAEIKELEKQQSYYENYIKEKLGEKIAGTTGMYRAFWKPVETKRLDTNAIKEKAPDIYEKYAKTTQSRRFEIKECKGE